MANASVVKSRDDYDQFGFSSADLTPRFGPDAMALIEAGWDDAARSRLSVVDETTVARGPFVDRIEARHVSCVSQISKADWNRLFGDVAEDWDYYTACEASNPEMFELSAMVVFDGERLVGAVPMFRMNYRLDMSLPDVFKGLVAVVDRMAPKMVRMPVLGFGSPMSEICALGFAPELSFDERKTVLSALVSGALDYAKAEGVKLTAFKDVSVADQALADEVLPQFGYGRMASLPVATLSLPFDDRSAYLATLSANMRKSLKRKIKQSRDVVVEVVEGADEAVLNEILGLYRETRANRSSSFEGFDEVPDSYFKHVVENMEGRARMMLFRVDGMIIGFNLFLEENDRVIGKFVGMHYKLSRKYNIYFVNWLEMVSYCLERGIGELHVGQTTYELKTKLGCDLKRSWIYFRHQGRVLGPMFKALGAKFGLDQGDPDLKSLGDRAPYIG